MKRADLRTVDRIIAKAITNDTITNGPTRVQRAMIARPFALLPLLDAYIPIEVVNEGGALGYRSSNYGGELADEVAEGAAKPEDTTLEITEDPAPFITFAGFVKASANMLKDTADLPAFLEDVLRRKAALALDANIIGQITNVYAGTKTGIDAIIDAINITATATNVHPDTIALAPSTFLEMAKADAWSANTGERFLGMNVALSYGLAPNEFACGPFASQSLFTAREAFEMIVGMEGTDFIDNMRTVLGEARGVWTTPDLAAFVIGDIV
jgi:hypothetical protein